MDDVKETTGLWVNYTWKEIEGCVAWRKRASCVAPNRLNSLRELRFKTQERYVYIVHASVSSANTRTLKGGLEAICLVSINLMDRNKRNIYICVITRNSYKYVLKHEQTEST